MRANRGRDTGPEMAVRRALHRRGLRYRVGVRPVIGLRRTADIVFPRQRVAVFIDGCFWHGCPNHATWPKANARWWRNKIETNIQRDRDTDILLRRSGWRVLRFWEHEDSLRAARAIERAVGTRRRALRFTLPPPP